MSLIDQRKHTEHDRQAAARAGYAALLRRAASPEPGDVEELARHMNTLGIDDAQFARDVDAVNRHAVMLQRRLSDEDRQKIIEDGRNKLAAAQDAVREFLAVLVRLAPSQSFQRLFDALDQAAIAGEQLAGRPLQNASRAMQWGNLRRAVMNAENEPKNLLDADNETNRQIATLQQDHPEAFGRPAPAPRPTSVTHSPVPVASDGKVTFSTGPGYQGQQPRIGGSIGRIGG